MSTHLTHNTRLIRLNNGQNKRGKGTGKVRVISASQDCVGGHVQIRESPL